MQNTTALTRKSSGGKGRLAVPVTTAKQKQNSATSTDLERNLIKEVLVREKYILAHRSQATLANVQRVFSCFFRVDMFPLIL